MTLNAEDRCLVSRRDKEKFYSAIFDMMTSEMTVNLNMLGSFVKNVLFCLGVNKFISLFLV